MKAGERERAAVEGRGEGEANMSGYNWDRGRVSLWVSSLTLDIVKKAVLSSIGDARCARKKEGGDAGGRHGRLSMGGLVERGWIVCACGECQCGFKSRQVSCELYNRRSGCSGRSLYGVFS